MRRSLLSLLTVAVSLVLLGGRERQGTVWIPPSDACGGYVGEELRLEEYTPYGWVPVAEVTEGDCVTGVVSRLMALRLCCLTVDVDNCSDITVRGAAATCISTYALP